MKMTMYDLGRINYTVKTKLLLPNIQLISNSLAKQVHGNCIITDCGFIIETNDEYSIALQDISEIIYRIVRTILYDNIGYITNECLGYSINKTEKDAVFYIDNYTKLLYTCIQLSPTSYNIILI